MVGTGDGSTPSKVISQSDAPFDAGSVTKPATAESTGSNGVRVVAKTFEQVRAEMKAKAAGIAPKAETPAPKVEAKVETKPAETPAEKPAETKPETTTATVEGISDAELSTFVAASKDRRAASAKIKALENDPNVQLAKDIAAAVAAGDHRKAAQLAKIDVNKLNDQEIAAANEKPKTPEQEQIAALQAQVNKLTGNTEEQHRAKGRSDIADSVIADPKTYPTLAADRKAIDQALDHAETAWQELATEKKRRLTQEETTRLFAKCLADAETNAASAKAAPATDASTEATDGKKRIQHSTQPDPPSSRQQSNPRPSSTPSKPLSFDEARKLIWAKK